MIAVSQAVRAVLVLEGQSVGAVSKNVAPTVAAAEGKKGDVGARQVPSSRCGR